MLDGWLLTRIVIGASALVFVLYLVFGVVLPWWRQQRMPGREHELEEQLERLRARHRQQQAMASQELADDHTDGDHANQAPERCD